MNKRTMTPEHIAAYGSFLIAEEPSSGTVENYLQAARTFLTWADGQPTDSWPLHSASPNISLCIRRSRRCMPYPRGSHSSPCGKRKFTGYAHGGTMKMYFRAEHCRAEHCRVDGKEAGGAVCPGTSPQNRPGIPKHNRTKKTVIAHMGGCGLFLSAVERRFNMK